MTSSKGRAPKLYPFREEMLSTSEIAVRRGLEESTIRYRIKHGIPLDAPNHGGVSLTESGEHPIGSAADALYWSDDLEARVWHMYCGGDDFGECTLHEIAALWDVTRQRVEQIQHKAIEKIRAKANRGDPDAIACRELINQRLADIARRRPSCWEWAESLSPGFIEIAAWEKTHSHAVVAALSGRGADVSKRAVEAAKRGNKAASRVSRRRRSA